MEKTENNIIDETAENQTPISKKDGFYKSMRERFSDVPEDDEEGFYGKMGDEFNSLTEYQTKNRETNKQIAEVLQAEPSLARVIKGIAEGMTLRESLSRFVDLEGLTAAEGDPDYTKLSEAKEARMKEMEANQKAMDKFSSNMEMSMKELNDFAAENNMSEDEVAGFIKFVDDMVDGFISGKINKNHLMAWRKSQNYENDIKVAADMAAADARNEKIETKKAMKPADEVPDLTGGVEKMDKKPPMKESDSVFVNAIKKQNRRVIK